MPTANIQQINEALRKIKVAVNLGGSNFVFRRRQKNEDTLLKLGYLHKHVLEEILGLTFRNYCSGPAANISRSGSMKGAVWVFGKEISKIEVYIKIQIIPQSNENKCVCISFHEAERVMRYPYAS